MSSLTKSQRLAIEAKGPRILVSAGAGSGKTRVLVERVLHLVHTFGIPTERILALTFTDQAALEMKERIEGKLGHTDATILTFHRFCGRIVRENPLLADVDPAFTLLDEATARALLRELIDRQLYESGSEKVIRWMEECGTNIARDLIASLYERWRESSLDIATLRERTEKSSETSRLALREEMHIVMNQLANLLQSGTVTASGTITRMQAILSAWERFLTIGWQTPNQSGEETSQQTESSLQELFSEVTRNVAKDAKPLFEKLAAWKKDQLWRDLVKDQTADIRDGLFLLMEQIDRSFRLLKEEYGWCDFADLQGKAYCVLHQSKEARTKYGTFYSHILVDEFQDTSPIQQAILEMLEGGSEGETSLFMVGDMRQSIYRFRGADVSGFERVRDQLAGADSYIQLRENFRSCPSLVAFISDMTKSLFQDEGAIPGLQVLEQVEEPVVELLVPTLDGVEEPREAEAQLIARRIVEMGPALWGDVAILLQTRTHLGKYQRALELCGIPYIVYAGSGYWDRQEVQDLFHLFRAVDNLEDDIAILGYLRGPLVSISDDGLWRLAKEGGLRNGFLAFITGANVSMSEQDVTRLKNGCELLLRLRHLYDEMGLADWIYTVLYEEGIAQQIGFTGFDRIVQMADELEKRGEIHLSDLLGWWERLSLENDKDGENQARLAKGAVRLMTVHAAKGLEFPIVFIPDLTHRYTSGIGKLHLSDTWGLTAQYYEMNGKCWLPSLSFDQAREAERTAVIAEQKRLFYVAMTRAQERLILSGSASAFTEKSSLEECLNWFDWLQLLIPELREGALTERIIERQGWKLRIRGKGEANTVIWPIRAPRMNVNFPIRQPVRSSDRTKRRVVSPSRPWSVTEWVDLLAGHIENDKQLTAYVILPFSGNTNLEAYQWGHVLHMVLEHLRHDDDLNSVRDRHLITALASLGITSTEAVDLAWKRLEKDIEMYVKSQLHSECREAQTIYSELPFAIQLFNDAERQRNILSLYGVIDKVWLRPDGGATLVDFKTHRCRSAADLRGVVDRYTPQVQLYAHVVEKLLGWTVDRAGLYLTTTGSFVEVPCDSAARERLLKRMYRIWKVETRQRQEIRERFS